MLGATRTTNGPEGALAGMVIVIEVAPHALMVAGVPLSDTMLLPWEAPKPLPEITTSLPTDGVVLETPEITGGVADEELIDTLSKVAVDTPDEVPLFTARPMYTPVAILIDSVVEQVVQVTPSIEVELVNVLPVRAMLTQYGGVAVTLQGSVVLPPVLVRASKYIPPYAGQSDVLAFAELAFKVSRIMTPAVAYAEPPWMLTTRATIVPSSDSAWYTK
jgi:hypothetical protein